MNRLVIMVGLPGSGKSTYAKMLLKLNEDWKYVSRDEVRYEYVTDQEHYFDHEFEVYKEFCNRIDKYLLDEKTVIADATHLTVGSRQKLLKHLTVIPDEVYVVIMTTPFDTCFERNAAREGIVRVPDKTMYQMKNNYRPPNARVETYINRIIYV